MKNSRSHARNKRGSTAYCVRGSLIGKELCLTIQTWKPPWKPPAAPAV